MKLAMSVTSKLCAILIAVLVASAQAPEQSTTITTRTEFVQIPVLVQRGGKHVEGLTKADFTLRQDGKEQPIAAFEEVHGKATQKQEITAAIAAGQTPAQFAILAIDTINTAPLDQAYFKDQLIKFLDQDKPLNSPMCMVTFNRGGIIILRDFTTDRRALLATARSLAKSISGKNNDTNPQVKQAMNEALQRLEDADDLTSEKAQQDFKNMTLLNGQQDRMSRFQDMATRVDTLLILQQLAQSVKGIPGRKALLWAGAGFPNLPGSKGALGDEFKGENQGQALNQSMYTAKLLNDANVAVYPIDARRTVNTAFEVMDSSLKNSPTYSDKEGARERDAQIVDTFKSIAADTGGKPCIYRTDLDACLREATDDDRDYYLLGFYVDKQHSEPGWHKVNLSVSQKANVRYRQGFIITKVDPEKARVNDIQLALNSPYPYTALQFSGHLSPPTGEGEKKHVAYELKIPKDSVTIDKDEIDLDIIAITRATGGKEAARVGQRIHRRLQPQDIAEIQRNGISYHNKIELPPGEYGVWFVLRDNPSGRTGSVTVPLKL